MTDAAAAYFQKLPRTALLTADDERRLSETIRRGGAAQRRIDTGNAAPGDRETVSEAASAKTRFVEANLRLVVPIARSYRPPQGMDLLDLIQEGNIGLHAAVERYDGRRGTRFSVYARHWIREGISSAITDRGPLVRIPSGRLVRLRAALAAAGNPEQLDADNSRVHLLRSPVSLDSPLRDGGGHLGDVVADAAAGPEDQAVTQIMVDAVIGMVEQLPETQRHAVQQRFGLHGATPRTCRDIADDLGVTTQAVWDSAARGVRSLARRSGELRAA